MRLVVARSVILPIVTQCVKVLPNPPSEKKGKDGAPVLHHGWTPVKSCMVLTAGYDGVVVQASAGFSISVPIVGRVSERGGVAVIASDFLKVLKELPEGDISLELKDGKLLVMAGRSKYSVIDHGEANVVMSQPKIEKPTAIALPVGKLRGLIKRGLIFSTSEGGHLPHMSGGLLENREGCLRLTSTDGTCASWAGVESSIPVPGRPIIPAGFLKFVDGFLDGKEGSVFLEFGARDIRVKFGDTTLGSRLLEGEFPKVSEAVKIPENRYARFNRLELLAALVSVGVSSAGPNRRTVLRLSDAKNASKNDFLLTANSELSQAVIPVEAIRTQGIDSLSVAFNLTFLCDMLEATGEDEVILWFEKNNGIVIVTAPEDPTWLAAMSLLRD